MAHRHLHQGGAAQHVVVVEILVAAGQTVQVLGDQVSQGVGDALSVPRVVQSTGHRDRRPILRSNWRSSIRPLSELSAPPSKLASIARRPRRPKSSSLAVHFGIGTSPTNPVCTLFYPGFKAVPTSSW